MSSRSEQYDANEGGVFMSDADHSTGLLSQVQSGAVPWTLLAGVIGAALLGVLLLYGAGLAGSEVIHNAAHDARHAFAFPCH